MSFLDFQMQIKKDGTRNEIENLQLEIDDLYSEVNAISAEIKRLYASKPSRDEYQHIQALKQERSTLYDKINEVKELRRDLQEYLHSLYHP